MKSRKLIFSLVVVFVVMIAGGMVWYRTSAAPEKLSPEAVAVLEAPESFHLYSLHPVPVAMRKSSLAEGDTNKVQQIEQFHGFEILGRTEISEAGERTELMDALRKGIAEAEGEPLACFDPRHAIRAVKGDVTVDLVICFECESIMEIVKTDHWLRTSHTPRDTFNNALKKANLPLAPVE